MQQTGTQHLNGSIKLGSYLRRLRQGYGYSLRKVEEKARQCGGDIDNSQLSRYEKGICYPSFDKLRILASIFNVSVQAFSDVIDLETLDTDRPGHSDAGMSMKEGHEELNLGNYARAYVCFEHAIELIEEKGSNGVANINSAVRASGSEQMGRARLYKAIALQKLGKLSLSEHELRVVLRSNRNITERLLARVVLQLSNIHAELGDTYMAEIEAHRALEMARHAGDREAEAMAFHGLGWIADEQDRTDEAIASYTDALRIHEEEGNRHQALTLRASLGGLYLARGQSREGLRLIRDTLEEAKSAGFRRQVAFACTKMAEAYYRRGEGERVRKYARESDAIAGSGEVKYVDILFANAYYVWKIASTEGNQTQERIAFGRLKYLRPNLERMTPEVSDFDANIEMGKGRKS